MVNLIGESDLICKNCDVNVGKLSEILSCPKCKEKLLNINFDLMTENERLRL